MDDFNYEEFNKRYDKFKNNNLPTPYYDIERQVLEYVFFDKNLFVDTDLIYPLEEITNAGFYYSYNIKDYFRNPEDKEAKLCLHHTHEHHFRDVVRDLYMHPESFCIDKSDYELYSNQELKFLFQVKAYLNLFKMKDIYKGKDNRYNNKLYNKYKNSMTMNADNNLLNKFISKKLNYVIQDYKCNMYDDTNRFMLISNNYQFKLFIKIIKKDIVIYKDIKNDYHMPGISDNDKVIKYTFEIIEYIDN